MREETTVSQSGISGPAAHAPARDRSIDLVKTIAILDVLISHVAVGTFARSPVGAPGWLCSLFWASISHVSVSLFLLASGALLLDPAHALGLKKLYTKNFPRLLAALLFWAVCYKLFGLWGSGGLNGPALVQALKEVVVFRHEEHLYYLHIMLLVYAFLPVTRLLTAHADRRLLQYALALWFLLGIVYPTVKTFWPFTLLGGIPKQWLMNMTYASIGYTVLGGYLRRWPVSRRMGGALTAAAAAAIFGLSAWRSVRAGKLDTLFLEGMSLFVCLLAVGIWSLCAGARPPERLGRVLTYISKASFCVFLTHIFFLKGLAHVGIYAGRWPALVSVPAMSLVLLACGCGVYAVLSRLPGIRRWLV